MTLPNELIINILESIGQPALIFHDNHVIAVNNSILDLIGYSEAVLYRNHLLKFIHPSSRHAALRQYREMLNYPATTEAISLRLCPSYDKPRWGEISVKPAPYVGENCYLAIIRNITENIIVPSINYPSIVEQLPVGIYRTLVDGTIIYANQTFAKIMGFQTVAELKQHKITEFFVQPQQRQSVIDNWQQQTIFENEALAHTIQGNLICLKTIGEIVADDAGNIRYLQGSVQDVTKTIQQELDLKQRHQELEILHQISVQLGNSLDMKNTLQTILEQVRHVIPYVSASIFLMRQGKLELLAEIGIPEKAKVAVLAEAAKFTLISQLKNPNTADILVLPDVRQSPDWYWIEGIDYTRSWLGLALRYQDEVIGILNFDHTETNFYNSDHMRYAQTVAQQAAVAIANAQYYETAQDEIRRRHEAQNILINNLINTETIYWVLRHLFAATALADVLDSVINMISAALEKTEVMLVVFEPESGELQHMLKSDDADFDTWSAFQAISHYPDLPPHKMPAYDFEWLDGYRYQFPDGRKAFAATVWKRGMLIAIRDNADVDAFSEANCELLVTIANQLTIALQNEENKHRLEKQSERLQKLADQKSNRLEFERKSQNAILDATAEGIFYMENFRMQYANPAFCRMVGYTLSELYGQPLSFIRPESSENEMSAVNHLLEDENLLTELGSSETKLRHKDGTEFYANIRFSMIGEPGDDMLRMVAVARDITQERELYFQRARFIANAAHELRNPLSSLVLRTHMMKRQPENAGKHVPNLERVVDYLSHIVEELLDLSRFERGTIELERTEFELQDVLRESVENASTFASEQSITINLNMPDEVIMMRGDRTRILQMLNHLIINGINYNEAGGKVIIQTQLEHDHLNNRTVIIEVVDDGIGISPDLLPSQIFEPFVRPSEGSRRETGMGLALTREIVQLHGGTIHARSIAGEGSTFRVMLPLT